ncbi:hypothetical protein Agabi119p4_3374 [Agaricus bisporus var. burnettii]|uniref:Tyr recombinase domain-containing protein n=1 Tax=Agaricus bisporus var. burnettii TaxID=192524 RepID=A0A8H7F731_AGABI|nr:hypothetical protein Agabi119p4_3371 [Agaricus bisporus var. burnettii]KAF7779029.1 hypothetical protein Agabi119p4_3374 [Agaricus bisporus var. burnettii]
MLDIDKPAYQGLSEFTANTGQSFDEEVADDIDAEQESFALVAGPTTHGIDAEFREMINAASRGVTDKTADEYRRLMASCEEYLRKNNFISPDTVFFSSAPLQDGPHLVVAWIMNSCDEINLNGTPRPISEVRSSYTHAMKMRAAMTYAFGRLHQLGNIPWHFNEASGRMEGNPSVSSVVSTYMLSLRRRKVQAGEAPVSARAITPEIMRKLYNSNTSCPLTVQAWAGPVLRKLLMFAYTLAFTCLLRIDELLKIQVHDLQPEDVSDLNCRTLILRLPFRKTSQFGNIEPFVLTEFPPHMAHLCPVRACAAYFHATQIKDGYIFRRMMANDRIAEGSHPMTAEQFLEMFRMNLLDIGVDYVPYGTHSFRRGGCQWMSVDLRWHLRDICEWGGWSTDLTHLTIVKYLISSNDSPMNSRKDFFNFNRPPTVKCWSCGRSCHCA